MIKKAKSAKAAPKKIDLRGQSKVVAGKKLSRAKPTSAPKGDYTSKHTMPKSYKSAKTAAGADKGD